MMCKLNFFINDYRINSAISLNGGRFNTGFKKQAIVNFHLHIPLP